MAEMPIEVTPEKENVESIEATPGTPQDKAIPEKSEEAKQLEAQKAQLLAEIEGLEGTKASLLDDVVRTRKEKREVADDPPLQVDVEAIKAEIEESVMSKVSGDIVTLKEQLVQAKDSEIAAKKAVIESINARMASASGSSGQASPDSITDNNEVELSNDEKEVAALVGLSDPRYLKDVELRR